MSRFARFYHYLSTRSLTRKFMLLLLVFSLTPLAIVGYMAYSTASNALRNDVEEKLLQLNVNTVNTIDRILFERFQDARVWSMLEIAKSATETGSGATGATEFVNRLARQYRMYRLLLILNAEGDCVTVNTVNHNGKMMPTNRLFLSRNFGEASWFQEAMRGKRVVATDWGKIPQLEQLAAELGQPQTTACSMIFASAIRDDNGGVSGVWANVLDWKSVQELLQERQMELSPDSGGVDGLLLLSDNDTVIASTGRAAPDQQRIEGQRLSVELRHPRLTERLKLTHEGMFFSTWNGAPKAFILTREEGFEQYDGHGWSYLMIADLPSKSRQITRLRARMLAIAGGVALLSLLFAYMIGKRLSAPLVMLSNAAATVAEGDLTKQIPQPQSMTGRPSPPNETKRLIASFMQMTQNLRELLKNIKQASGYLHGAATRMTTATRQQTSVSERQKAEIERAMNTIGQFLASATEIAENAAAVAEFANLTEEEAHQGVQAAVGTLARIHAIKQANDENMRHVMALHERSKEINAIVDVITSIAEQTDLIAFNAALEAASAGEKGTRFGVVANEIRRLANTVADSVKDIHQKTTVIQEGIRTMAGAFEAETQRIECGVTDMNITAVSLESILERIQKTTELLTHISHATSAQQSLHEQVLSGLREMSADMSQFQDITGQTQAITMELADLSQTLQQTVNIFKIEA